MSNKQSYLVLFSEKGKEMAGTNTTRLDNGDVVEYTCVINTAVLNRKHDDWRKHYQWDDTVVLGYSDGNVISVSPERKLWLDSMN